MSGDNDSDESRPLSGPKNDTENNRENSSENNKAEAEVKYKSVGLQYRLIKEEQESEPDSGIQDLRNDIQAIQEKLDKQDQKFHDHANETRERSWSSLNALIVISSLVIGALVVTIFGIQSDQISDLYSTAHERLYKLSKGREMAGKKDLGADQQLREMKKLVNEIREKVKNLEKIHRRRTGHDRRGRYY